MQLRRVTIEVKVEEIDEESLIRQIDLLKSVLPTWTSIKVHDILSRYKREEKQGGGA